MAEKIYQSLGKIMSDVGAIGKNQENSQQGFKFRGIDDFMNTLHGLFAKHGVVIVPTETEHIQESYNYVNSYGKQSIQFRSRLHMNFMFISTEDGSMVVADGWGEAADNGDKGYNKCKSIALKYVLMQMFLVPTADIADPDRDTPDELGGDAVKTSPTVDTKPQDRDSIIRDALSAVEKAKTRKELESIYGKFHPLIGKDAKFVKALNDKSNAIGG